MKKKQLLSCALITAMTASLITGCGSTGSASSAQNNSQSDSAGADGMTEISKSATTSSTGGLILALKRAMLLLVQKDGYRKQFSLVRYKAVPLDSSFLVSSACSFIYF